MCHIVTFVDGCIFNFPDGEARFSCGEARFFLKPRVNDFRTSREVIQFSTELKFLFQDACLLYNSNFNMNYRI